VNSYEEFLALVTSRETKDQLHLITAVLFVIRRRRDA